MPMQQTAVQSIRRAPAPKSRRELMLRARALSGRTVHQVAAATGTIVPASSVRGKGFIGQLVEVALGADPQAGVGPDFSGLGVELKTLPISPSSKPLESTFVCSIDMLRADRETFAASIVKRRLRWVLWMPVVALRGTPIGDRIFGRARLWQPSPRAWAQLEADWNLLMGAIGAGGSGHLTARSGAILQVRPKARSRKDRVVGLEPDGVARVAPLGFYLRPAFTARAVL